ncbi:hypothetical protein [Nocardiopsis protaetiae]|uniref:hypothetical protein n=1 Tax=Nocardiopsis protaetiae TaxID=3382270 RepID=UPI00387B0710
MNPYPSADGDPWQQQHQQQPYDPSAWNPSEGYGAIEPYGHPTGGYAPVPAGPAPGSPEEPVLSTIGDIAITQSTVITPAGRFPIRGTVWTVTDMTRTERTTPAWAIVVAILVFWWTCLLGLLFLLVKEEKTSGHVQVTVQGHGHYHAASIPAAHRGLAAQINQQVNYARSLAA